jgi:chemotaxis protein methyltransferase CheR
MTAGTNCLAVERLGLLLTRHTGQILTEARRWRIETSLRPLLRVRGLASLDALLLAIERDPGGSLLAETLDAMLNHESYFFRDIAVFKALETEVLPALRAQAGERTLRIWCAGCSTGQEAYSLAMMIRRMDPSPDGARVAILGTDISPLAIDKAKRGRFPQIEMQRGLPINDLLRWFRPVGEDWQIDDEIRAMVSFQTDNLLEPRRVSGQFDLILCRNILFYFPEELRRRACDELARRARPGTFLVLGAGEMLAGGNAPFSNCRELSCIYVADRPARIATIINGAAA